MGPWILLTLSAFLFGFTLVVAIRFMLHYRVIRANGKERAVLPLHVWVVALSYDLFLLGAAVQSFVLVRWWHYVIDVPAILLGIWAMWVLNRAQHGGDTPYHMGVQER